MDTWAHRAEHAHVYLCTSEPGIGDKFGGSSGSTTTSANTANTMTSSVTTEEMRENAREKTQ